MIGSRRTLTAAALLTVGTLAISASHAGRLPAWAEALETSAPALGEGIAKHPKASDPVKRRRISRWQAPMGTTPCIFQ